MPRSPLTHNFEKEYYKHECLESLLNFASLLPIDALLILVRLPFCLSLFISLAFIRLNIFIIYQVFDLALEKFQRFYWRSRFSVKT